MTIEELLQQILNELHLLRTANNSPIGIGWDQLLTLPDHLRKTVMVVAQQGRVTANDITNHTHRVRAVESAYCNQLVVAGILKKERVGRKVYFSLEVK